MTKRTRCKGMLSGSGEEELARTSELCNTQPHAFCGLVDQTQNLVRGSASRQSEVPALNLVRFAAEPTILCMTQELKAVNASC